MQGFRRLQDETGQSSESILLRQGVAPYASNHDSVLPIANRRGDDDPSWPSSHDPCHNISGNGSRLRRHRDGLGRVEEYPSERSTDGYYLRCKDARLAPVWVQKILDLRDKMPWAIRVTEWIFKPTITIDDGEDHQSGRSLPSWMIWDRYAAGIPILMLLTFSRQQWASEARNLGQYDPVPYREWLVGRFSRSTHEDPEGRDQNLYEPKPKTILERDFGPKYLCMLREPTAANPALYERKQMDMQRSKSVQKFVFVSYTRLHFPVNARTEIDGRPLTGSEKDKENEKVKQNREILKVWGHEAAKDAGVKAFWIDFECIIADKAAGDTEDKKVDVYRICDVIRAAHSMVIIRRLSTVGNSPASKSSSSLQAWGSRIWTVPEALLCPSNNAIRIYTEVETDDAVSQTVRQPGHEEISKQNLVRAAWDDWKNIGQLMDHYEGSLHLTPLELVSTALEGLIGRVLDQINPNTRLIYEDKQKEVSHSLMGLLRRRPLPDDKDQSGFETFARLSLANDSDQLLERLLCFQTPSPNAPWYTINDAWGAKLWDVEPHCQIAGVVENNTVVLDGIFGATIRWDDLKAVAFIKRSSWRNPTLSFVRISIPILLISSGILLVAAAHVPPSPFGVIGGILMAVAVILGIALPRLLLAEFGGKLWNTQAMFLGIEGIPDLGLVERFIFGFDYGRIKWSGAGSMLSRPRCNKYGELVGMVPEPDLSSGQRVYTLIDTFTMTATAFYAEQPPSVVFVCGSEGGMQRAVLCSYQWKTQSFCREVVLRMKTRVLERMSRVERVRFCLTRSGRDLA